MQINNIHRFFLFDRQLCISSYPTLEEAQKYAQIFNDAAKRMDITSKLYIVEFSKENNVYFV